MIVFRDGVLSQDDDRAASKAGHNLTMPFQAQCRGVERKIVISGSAKEAVQDPLLVALIADCHQWMAKVAAGEATTVREIARQVEIDEGDVSRFLPLAFLAPDIVEAILNGRQPVSLTTEKLKRLRNLPKCWKEQCQLLGYCP